MARAPCHPCQLCGHSPRHQRICTPARTRLHGPLPSDSTDRVVKNRVLAAPNMVPGTCTRAHARARAHTTLVQRLELELQARARSQERMLAAEATVVDVRAELAQSQVRGTSACGPAISGEGWLAVSNRRCVPAAHICPGPMCPCHQLSLLLAMLAPFHRVAAAAPTTTRRLSSLLARTAVHASPQAYRTKPPWRLSTCLNPVSDPMSNPMPIHMS